MSKANEWARSGGRPKDRLVFNAGHVSAHTIMRQARPGPSVPRLVFSEDGYRRFEITTAQAIALAHWILETFGEPAQSPHNPSPERG